MNKPRKWIFVLPNLFTVSSIFCGFFAISRCVDVADPRAHYQAALALLFAMFFDGFDGRVARMTRTQSQFGVELDSLADVISFGVAPAILAWRWALQPLGVTGLWIAFAFVACGALRLARFNVLAQNDGPSSHFVGLPIPVAAGTLAALVIAHHGAHGAVQLSADARMPLAVLMVVLSALMVSTVRYRTFKQVRFTPRSSVVLVAVVAFGVLITKALGPAYLVAAFALAYLAAGALETAVLLPGRLHAKRMARATLTLLEVTNEDGDDQAQDEPEADQPEPEEQL